MQILRKMQAMRARKIFMLLELMHVHTKITLSVSVIGTRIINSEL